MSDVVIYQRFRVKRDTAANFTSANTVLLEGEFGLETDTRKLKLGDGSTAWNSLDYLDASFWPYDNTTSGLTADNVQEALDELADEKLDDAPSDGNTYGRKDGAWAVAGGGGASFTPTELFDDDVTNGAWYDPNDTATLWQDTAGTVPVTAAGQTVARVDDKSGLGNHATQTTASARPTYRVDSAGYGYLDFDGNDWLDAGTAFNAESWMAGIAYMTNVNNCRLIDARGTGLLGTVKGWYIKGRNQGQDLIGIDDGGGTGMSFSDSASGITTGVLHSFVSRYSGGTARYILDRADKVSQNNTSASMGTITGPNPSRIGTSSSVAGTQSLTGSIYQIVVINRLGSFEEQRKLYQYLTGTGDF